MIDHNHPQKTVLILQGPRGTEPERIEVSGMVVECGPIMGDPVTVLCTRVKPKEEAPKRPVPMSAGLQELASKILVAMTANEIGSCSTDLYAQELADRALQRAVSLYAAFDRHSLALNCKNI